MDRTSEAIGKAMDGCRMQAESGAPAPGEGGPLGPVLRSVQGVAQRLARPEAPQPESLPALFGGLRFREVEGASSEEDASACSEEEESASAEHDALWAAIESGDVQAIDTALQQETNLQQRVKDEPQLLDHLAQIGYLEGVRRLLGAGADVNARLDQKRTPLIYAAAQASGEIINELLIHGAMPGKRDEAGNTALHVAVLCGSGEAVTALLPWMDSNEIERKNKKGASALFEAIRRKDTAIVSLLLHGGARTDGRWHELDCMTSLMLAAAKGDAKTLTVLLAAGARHDDKDSTLTTALIHAVRVCAVECVQILLKAGADVNAIDIERMTPLLWAIKLRHIELVDMLLRHGAVMTHAPRIVRMIGYTDCKTEDAEFFEEGMPSRRVLGPPFLEWVPQPALLCAVSEGLDQVVELLLGVGADANVADKYGVTALALAQRLRHDAIVERLLEFGAQQ